MKLKIAVASRGTQGLADEVPEVFGRAKMFTIIEVEDGKIKRVESVENPAATYEYGAGPIAIKFLADLGVRVAVGAEFGVGVSTLLADKNIRTVRAPPGTKVGDVVDKIIREAVQEG